MTARRSRLLAGRSESSAPRFLMLALEPRIMFDAAVAADAAHALPDAAAKATIPDATAPVLVRAADPTLDGGKKEVVFVDTSVANYKALEATIKAGVEIEEINGSQSGLAQIAKWAETRSGYDAIHLLSHGAEATIYLGTDALTDASLASVTTQAELAEIGHALNAGGDLLVYGCDVAAGSDGSTLLTDLASATGASVAASTDATGDASLGGNWTLERTTGQIDVAMLDGSAYDHLLTRPISGTTTFDSLNGNTQVIPNGATTTTLTDQQGWDFTMALASASDGVNDLITVEKVSSSTVYTVEAASDGSIAINYLSVKANDSSLFTLNSIAVVLSEYNNSFSSGGAVELVGYLNGSVVSGAALTLSVGDFMNNAGETTFTVSSNAAFQGIDSFRVVATGSNSITGTLGIGAINATNFHFPGPVLTTSGGSSTYSGGSGSAVTVDSSLTLSDTASSTQASATVSITNNFHSGEDVLAFTNNNSTTFGNIVGSYNSATGVLTLTSSGSVATTAQWQAALEKVTYQDTSSSPSTSTRTVSFSITDNSANTSATVTKSVSVAADVAPVISNLNGDSGTYAAGAGGGAVHLDAGTAASVTDSDGGDFSSGNLTVHISANAHSAEDVLGIDTSGSVALSSGTAVGSSVSVGGVIVGTIASDGVGSDLTINFNSNATAARVSTLVQALLYSDSAATPNTATRTIQVSVDDGHGQSTTSSVMVAINDAALLTASSGSAAFTAGDNVASTPVAVDSGLTLVDHAASTLASATVSITGNFHSGQDILAFTNTNSASYGNIVATYNASTGVLTLISSGASATLAQWQAALRAVTYSDSAVTPNSATRTLSFQVTDAGSNSSAAVTRTVTVTGVDQTPIVATSGGSAAFSAGDNTLSPPVVVDSGLTLSDLDNSTLVGATVSISANFHAGEDLLAFTNTSSLTYGNVVASYNAGTGMLTLTSSGGTATLAQWQAALRAVTYLDSAVTPNSAPRTISFTVSDGTKSNVAATRQVTVSPTDQTPLVTTTGGSSAFAAGDNSTSVPVAVDSGITLSDLDNSTLASASVAITGNFHAGEDVLAFSNSNSALYGNISASYSSSSGVLTMSSSGASATLAQWQAALRAVTYTDVAVTPDSATRTISFAVNDGSKSSAIATRIVTITDTNQTPIVTPGAGSASYLVGSASPLAVDGALTLSDRDNSTLASASVSITTSFQASEDVLAFTNTSSALYGNVVASYNSATGVLTLTSSGATATLAQWQAALRAVTYQDSAATPNTATRTISFQVSDGTKNSAPGTRNVTLALPAPSVGGLSASTDTGVSDSDGITSNATPTVTGSALAGSTVTVYVDSLLAGTTTADASGAWSLALAHPLSDGPHRIGATASDAAGNASAASAAFTCLVETGAPTLTVSLAAGQAQGAQSPISGTVADSWSNVQSVAVTLSNGATTLQLTAALGNGGWTVTPASPLADGIWQVDVVATNAAGKQSSVWSSFTVSTAQLQPNAVNAVNRVNPVNPVNPVNAVNAATVSPISAGADYVPSASDSNPPGETVGATSIPFLPSAAERSPTLTSSAAPTSSGSALVSSPPGADRDAPDQLLVVNAPVTMQAQVGQEAVFQLPAGIFLSSNPEAQVTVDATQADGSPLPGWLHFDAARGTLSGKPPAGGSNVIEVRITARDDQGNTATTVFKLNILKGKSDGATAAPADKRAQAPVGRPSLTQQFARQAQAGWLQDPALLKHLQQLAATQRHEVVI